MPVQADPEEERRERERELLKEIHARNVAAARAAGLRRSHGQRGYAWRGSEAVPCGPPPANPYGRPPGCALARAMPCK